MSLGVNGSSAGAGEDIIKTGTYTGDGTYGSSNAKSLTFNKEPNLVMITGGLGAVGFFNIDVLKTSSYQTRVLVATVTNQVQMNTNVYAKYDTSTNTLSWYPGGNSYTTAGLNSNGYKYTWVAYF